MKLRKCISFLMAIIMISSIVIIAFAAGDTMQSATSINLNTSYSGSITNTNTKDYYKVTLSTSGRVNVRITAYIYETDYYIYDANGNKVWEKTYQYWNGTSEEYNLDENVDLTSGTYYFAVQQRSGTGNYNFKLSFTNANESFNETAGGTNNSIATASAISTGKTYYGQIACNDSKDIYKVTLSTSGRVNVRITAYIYETDYFIYDTDGNKVWEKTYQYWNDTSEEYNLDENVDLTSGTYYFSVQQHGSTGNYNFKLSFTGANESFNETTGGINNTTATASAISTGTTYYGQIACNDSKDIYKFTLSRSGKVNIRLTAYIYETDYYIYDANGNKVWEKTYQYWNSTSEEYNLDENVDLTSGTYYFSVQQHSGTGNYNFLIGGTNNPCSNGHTWGSFAVIKQPTCTEPGTKNRTCTVCSVTESVPIEALGHNWDSGTITKPATMNETGTRTYTCSRCRTTRTETIPKLGSYFSDVPETAYYVKPVAWAVEQLITSGTSATTFSPNADCTRAQVVTFLWRSAGSPSPKSSYNPFNDLRSDAYYYKAVLWAVENDITSGTSTTTFSPDATCTRAQVVTFLWRFEGKPYPDSYSNPFKDVKASNYYYTAVLWAVDNKVTSGTASNTFSPNDTCTRAQVVTFLYRDLVK